MIEAAVLGGGKSRESDMSGVSISGQLPVNLVGFSGYSLPFLKISIHVRDNSAKFFVVTANFLDFQSVP